MNPSKCPESGLKPAKSFVVPARKFGPALLRAGLTLAGGIVATTTHAQSNYATPLYITTLAGTTTSGAVDGANTVARFNTPQGVAVNRSGTVYVADTNNHVIRKIQGNDPTSMLPATVSTLAGQFGISGNATATGTRSTARFNLPRGVAYDTRTGDVYVADTSNHAIRKIAPSGEVTTVAGSVAGAVDGPGAIARLFSPNGIAVDLDSNLYVADTANHAIRKITPVGVVSTLAGQLGTFGGVDGTGGAARFSSPRGVAVDWYGYVYVADRDNNSIRKISPAGVVTTLAGNLSFNPGSADGLGSAARFNQPYAVAVSDREYAVYVVESGNSTIRKISLLNQSMGEVTTLAGTPLLVGSATNVAGSAVRFFAPQGIAVDEFGNLTIADTNNHSIRLGVAPVGAVVFAGLPSTGFGNFDQTVNPGAPINFYAETKSNVPYTLQWRKDGVAIPGATANHLSDVRTATGHAGAVPFTYSYARTSFNIAATNATDLGGYSVVATNMAGTSTSNVLTISFPVSTAGRLTNLSILTAIPTAGETFTMGYVVGGSGTSGNKLLVIRAVGPSLIPLGVTGTLNDPKIELFAGATKTTENDNWGGAAAISTAMAGVGAFAFTGPTSLDAALATSITTPDNSVRVSAAGTGTGTVIAEIYDATPAASFFATTPRLVNVSVLKALGTGLTVGFVIGGTQSKTVLIRAVGPTLGAAPFNVSGVVANPQLTLFSGATSVASNDDWGGNAALTAAFSSVGAFALPATSRDAALVSNLQPGNYTVQVSGVGGTTGIAIVEVYEVP